MARFMMERQRRILSEHTVRSQEEKIKKVTYLHGRHSAAIQQACRGRADADRSDPFAYARVQAHFRCGLADLKDYGVTWRQEERSYTVGEEVRHHTVSVPTNMKVPS